MTITEQIARHLRAVYFGGNWTASNLKDQLAGVGWQQATTQVAGFNTIATLVFHLNYYVGAILKVLRGGPLDAKDQYSFDHPPIQSQDDWEKFLEGVWADAENLAAAIGQLPENRLWDDFAGSDKYGNYYRNLHGVIEHIHYHLGQIALLRKMIAQP